jgi:malate synthase
MRFATATAFQEPIPTVSRADFTACVDGCVHRLASAAVVAANDPAQARLRAWLHGPASALEDGTPIDFALFDAALLSIGERTPASDAHAQKRLVHAARVLAERIYAGS